MNTEEYKNHIEALEKLAAEGDEMSIKSLACIVLAKETV